MIRQDGATLHVEGDMTKVDVVALERLGTALIRSGRVTALDLSAVGAADSAGLALLFAWQREAPTPLVVRKLPPTLQALGSLYGVEGLLQGFAAPAA